MSTMDIFSNDAFRTRELSEGINIIPNMWGRIGELGLFTPKPLRTAAFMIESQNGKLVIVQSSERGTDVPGAPRGKRELRDFRTRRFAQERRITADDISGIRQFGSETELVQVIDEVNDRLVDLRSNMDITREYLRAGAIAGVVLDADGTVIVDLFSAFGVTQKVVDFDLGTGATDHAGKAREVLNHIDRNMKGDVKSGVHALCSEGFFNKLLAIDDFKEAHKYYTSTVEPLRDDVRGGVPWLGITWEQYLGEGEVPQEDGTTLNKSFIAAGDARFFPTGTRQTFRDYDAPADYMEVVNTPGQPFYSKVMPDPKANRYADVEGQMNTLPMCMRPAVLVRGHSST